MPADKSLFYYGTIYNRFFDPTLAEARQMTLDLIDEGSSVLDLACGTGALCFDLAATKHCRVVGIDISLRMLEFAKNRNHHEKVTFLHLDATELAGMEDRSFDYATLLFVLHELPQEQRLRALSEALRVARHVIMIDSRVPLPKNTSSLGIRFVEATFGRDHYRNFKNFLTEGGIEGMFENLDQRPAVTHRSVFRNGCREVVVLSNEH